MVKIIDPVVNVVDYGPKIVDESGKVLVTPDEMVFGAAGITYKDTGALRELIDQKQSDADIREKMIRAIIASGGAGHASLTTTPVLYVFLEGNSSKMVDSLFTGARYGSSLMPSSRRVPIAKDQIVVPKSIANNTLAVSLYLDRSEKNIDIYEKLQVEKVPKEEAAKIVQYGHRGGGFLQIPLETLVYFSREVGDNPMMPKEARTILKRLERFVHEHGMEVSYEARKGAPRACSPNPNIFTDQSNLAQELIDQNFNGVLDSPQVVSFSHIPNEERDRKINEWMKYRAEVFSDIDRIKKEWPKVLSDLQDIVQAYNPTVTVTTISNSPWRVWGEVKRHRTLPQAVESIYHAIKRASDAIETQGKVDYDDKDSVTNAFNNVVSLPPVVLNNPELAEEWSVAFSDSVRTYNQLVGLGIPESDAVYVVPRGIKVGIVKQRDLYNMTTGYDSLRLCIGTVEPEMRRTTEQERALIRGLDIPDAIKQLMVPKCDYVGFCPEGDFKRCCGYVKGTNPGYSESMHEDIRSFRNKGIRERIERPSWYDDFMANDGSQLPKLGKSL